MIRWNKCTYTRYKPALRKYGFVSTNSVNFSAHLKYWQKIGASIIITAAPKALKHAKVHTGQQSKQLSTSIKSNELQYIDWLKYAESKVLTHIIMKPAKIQFPVTLIIVNNPSTVIPVTKKRLLKSRFNFLNQLNYQQLYSWDFISPEINPPLTESVDKKFEAKNWPFPLWLTSREGSSRCHF